MSDQGRPPDQDMQPVSGGVGADEGTPAPLIPNPRTRLDHRVNRAYELSRCEQPNGRRYVWMGKGRDGEADPIFISSFHPRPEWTDGWVVVVDPAGYALNKRADAEEVA